MKHNTPRTLLGLAITVLLAGCASVAGHPDNPSADSGKSTAPTTRPAPPTAAINNALLPAIATPKPQPAATEEHFDVAVKNIDARAFFMGLVKNTHYNMVVPHQLEGRVSLLLKNVTVPQVMDIVRMEYGYEYRRNDNVFMVLPETLGTRIFRVNYLDITRKGSSRTRVTSGGAPGSGGNNNVYGTTGLYRNSGHNNDNTHPREGRDSTRIVTKNDSDFWNDLATSLHAIVGTAGGRQVIVNSDSGVIVVRAMPGEMHNVAMYLSQVQGIVSREVVIEAKIVEVTLKNGFQSGINWGALGTTRRGGGGTVFGGQTGGGHLFDLGRSDLADKSITVGPGSSITSLPSSAFGGVFALALNLKDFSAFLELLQSQGDAHVLSSPRVATLNNQQAVIKVGSEEYFVTGVRQNTYVNTTTSQASNVILQPFFSGIALDVTPQINAHGQVTLHIHPTVSKVTDQHKTFTISGNKTSLPLAHSSVRESDSVVRANSGQIIVIGGLMKRQNRETHYKTPLLGDIPLLGTLFRHTKTQQIKTELVILLKPIVIDNAQQWSQLSQRSLHRVHNIGRQ